MVQMKDDRKITYKEWLDLTRQRLRSIPTAQSFEGWWEKEEEEGEEEEEEEKDDQPELGTTYSSGDNAYL
eukprot:CAMPEP_0173106088 /NCGR_PEP_ID=MMETSP1102-20130122/40668_1 /TAXON_ID=49646 /ORGANISM="Geminigera sp., Strain Caron Lab Isolate" /LENGTH=69 /DNA_ID=CAMNT_0014002809 /DNA_START=336 /DNA_END=543 /DNA_ORIENTATION=-